MRLTDASPAAEDRRRAGHVAAQRAWWIEAATAERLLVGGLLLVVAVNLAVRASPFADSAVRTLQVLCNVLFALAAVACLRRRGRSRWTAGWVIQGVGLLSYLAADVHAQAVGDDLGFPSISDALWLAFYVASFASVVVLVGDRTRGRSPRVWIDGLIAGLVAAALAIAFVVGPLLAIGRAPFSTIVVGLSYPIADLVLLVVLVASLRVSRPQLAASWLQVVGLGLFLIADLNFLVQQAHGTWTTPNPMELPWVLGVAVIGLGAATATPAEPTDPGEPSLVVPLAAALLVTALLLFGQRFELPLPSIALAVVAVVLVVARVVTAAGEIRRSARMDRHLRVDPLTALPTRHALVEQLESRLEARGGAGQWLLVVDVDGLDEINGSLGREAGDRVVRTLADRVTSRADRRSLVARLGGGSFAVAVPADADPERIARDVRTSLGEPVNVAGIPLSLTATVGIAAAPTNATSADALLFAADRAVRQARRSKSAIAFYVPQAADPSPRRLRLLAEIRAGLAEAQFVAHLQPQVDLADGEVVGAEVLARWLHPTLGVILPGEFMPLMVEGGAVADLTGAMVAQAEVALRRLSVEGRGIDVSLNVSALDLADEQVVAAIEQTVRRCRGLRGSLVLELTEDAVMVDRDRAVAVLERMRSLGARISVDDYGTGQASLSYLRDLPLDEVKIDRSFVQGGPSNGRAATLARSTIELAHVLGLVVVAEGVEDEATHDWLRSLGCDVAQGFLYARPVPLDGLVAWLQARRQTTDVDGEAAKVAAP